ncbi:DUF2288 domain-containing protein [Noviherbaspirillum massiliense]|uniref:DUF2288 domain-containing protein n=1 Tax=Noviherbaspirillum massiliense TaxID=1465823 RepID=UPI0002EEE7F2|nr:DUF2288 domain-containing protein [Noviherbaspirillum massiliense]
MTSKDQAELLRAKLNLETSRMPWKELLRYFAGGVVIAVSDDLDLIEVAACIANDDKDVVAQWMAESRVGKVSDAQAATWLEMDASLWAVVVKPWILVQLRAS